MSFGLPNEQMQNDQPSSSSAQVYDLVQMLRERMTSYSQRGGGYDGIEKTVGMCENRPNNKKDVAYKISQRAIASIPTASVIFLIILIYEKYIDLFITQSNLFFRYFLTDFPKISLFLPPLEHLKQQQRKARKEGIRQRCFQSIAQTDPRFLVSELPDAFEWDTLVF